MKIIVFALFSFAMLGATPSVFAAEDEEHEVSITLEKLPKAVRKAVELATQEGEIVGIELDIEDGMAMYDVEVEVEGGTVELSFNHDGQLVGIEVVEEEEEEEEGEGDGENGDKEQGDEEGEEGDDEEMGDEGDEKEEGDAEEGDDQKDDGDAEEGEESDEESAEVAKDINSDDLPKPALAAILKRSGDAKLVAVESITEAGATVYEAAWMVDEVKREVTVTADGDVVSEESSVTLEKLPNAVQEVAKKFGGASVLKLERKSMRLFELEIEVDGVEKEMLVDATGREVDVEYGDDEEKD